WTSEPALHVILDSDFTTVPFMDRGETPPNWSELCQYSSESYVDESIQLAEEWLSSQTVNTTLMSRKPQDILIESRALRGGLVRAVMARRLPRLGMRILIMPGLARDRLVLPYHEEVRNRQECFHASMELVQETAMLREVEGSSAGQNPIGNIYSQRELKLMNQPADKGPQAPEEQSFTTLPERINI
ncbi:hypothetical protein THAOC_33815, partial [Thalassiosira oceanica]